MPSSETNVKFSNILSDSEYFNIIKYSDYYNGAGVALGDINNDGLTDIYFVSNQWQNVLYLNKGDLEFEDITTKAGVGGSGNWKTGVTMADVNGDGFLDIFLCTAGTHGDFQGRTQLYINNGNLTFSDRTEEFGLAFNGAVVQTTFFDFDNDGDLDGYLLGGDAGRLFRNDEVNGNVHFTDLSDSTGIIFNSGASGTNVAISDFNNDGYQDIYRVEDLYSIGYVNLGYGAGKFRLANSLRQPYDPSATTGVDVADVNEDGLNDIATADEFSSDERIIRITVPGLPNTLFLNQGGKGSMHFIDAAAFAGVAATDISWAPLFFDFDLDGNQDLFISTGTPGRRNDLGNKPASAEPTIEERIASLPPAPLPNKLFRNTGSLKFDDISQQLGTPAGFSNGAAYSDLDNDGDLDLVVNNINAEAFILRNNADHDSTSYINLKLSGALKNTFGIGAKIKAYAGGKLHSREQQPVRGWLSSVDPVINIGLGRNKKIDSLIVIWPGGKYQKLLDVEANQLLNLKEENAGGVWRYDQPQSPLLEQVELFTFKHLENPFNTLDKQPLIPHASSNRGPRIVVADINGDKLDDVYVCGGQGQPGSVFVQTRAGKFVAVPQPAFEDDKKNEEIAAALFDVDGDKDADLMISSGGEEFLDKRTMLRLYLNNGRGTFTKTDKNLPKIYVNAPCIAPADVDNDGDLDVFVAGGVITGRYGFDSDSFILTNDGKGVFTGSAASFFERRNVGEMIQAAVWIDINNDKFPELITAGDWTNLQVWSNEAGVLKRQNGNGLDSIPNGWWTSLASADMDNDGDADIVAGNFGTNQRIQTAELFVSDLDNNGSLEAIMSPLPPRDVLLKQIPALEKRYPTYNEYANARIEQIVSGKQVFHRTAGEMHSVYIENLGTGKFKWSYLPAEAQFFPVFAINISDVDDDGNKDVLLAGNLGAVPSHLWRADNGLGVVLKGNGKGGFQALSPNQSGFIVKGEGRDIQTLLNTKKELIYLVGRNNDSLIVFKKRVK
ncbi:MAG TPA: VCBS repeat-containing protein [Cyclobacteriaceae bacterium]|nr:VCBS repeat-containing protein [Cyclobacteriaceae bacterium]